MEECAPGKLDVRCGEASYRYIEDAARGGGEGVGPVTAPINKAALNAAATMPATPSSWLTCWGPVTGYAPMTPSLRVSHVSTHCSLEQAIARATERIRRVAYLTAEAPGLASAAPGGCRLNPHAGEGASSATKSSAASGGGGAGGRG